MRAAEDVGPYLTSFLLLAEVVPHFPEQLDFAQGKGGGPCLTPPLQPHHWGLSLGVLSESLENREVGEGLLVPQDIGQMQLYKHYYEREMMNPGDNPPIGIVLGSDRDEAVIRYTLNEHERNLFAVKYHLHLPTVEELQMELMRERAAIEEAMALRALPPPESGRYSAPRKTSKGGK